LNKLYIISPSFCSATAYTLLLIFYAFYAPCCIAARLQPYGNPAVSKRPAAFRPRLATGLAFASSIHHTSLWHKGV
jgi:hypothetical protein